MAEPPFTTLEPIVGGAGTQAAHERRRSRGASLQGSGAVSVDDVERRKVLVRRTLVAAVGVAVVGAVIAVAIAYAPISTTQSLKVPKTVAFGFEAKFAHDVADAPTGPISGRMHKTEAADGAWQLDGKFWFTFKQWKTTVTIFDRRAYFKYEDTETGAVEIRGCVNGSMPDAARLKSILDQAAPLPSEGVVRDSNVDCEHGKVYVARFDDRNVALCARDGDLSFSTITGEDYTTVITDVELETAKPVVTQVPLDDMGLPLQCPQLSWTATEGIVSSSRLLRKLFGGAPAEAAAAPAVTPAPRGRALATKHRCIFQHGIGQSTDSSATSSFQSYWGPLETKSTMTAACSSFSFIHRNTVDVTWDDVSIQQNFCKVACDSTTLPCTITNARVFGKGYGALVIAGALKRGYCSLASTSKWFHAGGPWEGTAAANELERECQQNPTYMATLFPFVCSGTNLVASIASLKPTYSGSQSFAAVRAEAVATASGSMCGDSAYGLSSSYSSVMNQLESASGIGPGSDGLVPWASCAAGSASSVSWTQSYTAKHYKADINAVDEQCLENDGTFGVARMPCSWYGSMASL